MKSEEKNSRDPIKLTAKDQIEHEEFLKKRINRVREFTNGQGQLGEDVNSLDQQQQKEVNRYDPAISTGGETTLDKKARELHEKDESNVGMSYNKDRYVRERNTK